ncbi:Malolactic regulator [Lacticaseibacillus rhamnosus]|nr:Malolactic regulator [Lacticaseibacillus rhamnosus]MCT3152778.1 Malolactic regulator [Lacticaseibacillus rhamnosus]MCT3163044.1 Malolactic regulator [Lacticaseibacillus rhamnosus]MCT3165499.1 Malolactic regulator [Lacticaseibacillus rhamnosus]MCT3167098.1 Malolactic regulator [Lacticaseibacillus rhamnosus]
MCPLTLRLLSAPAHAHFITRSQSQQSTCKDLSRNGPSPAITPEATYTPIAKRSCSRSLSLGGYFHVNANTFLL